MNGKRICSLLALWMVLGMFGSSEAAAPWTTMLTRERIEADPEKTYALGEEHGPWLILASTFSGDGAMAQANALALELRKRYKLPAYVHRMKFDLGEAYGRGIDQFGSPQKMRYRRGSKIDEVAVLVGHYRAVADPDAQETLNRLKYMQPKCLEVEEGVTTHQSLAGWRWTQKQLHKMIGSEKRAKGPMGHAFVTTNPLLPEESFTTRGGIDPLVMKMNEGVPHSLLDCSGKYTVQVACFKGNVVIKQDEVEAIENGKQMESKLAKAALNAHRLTEALRAKGWDAYEFHDRYASIVTVGGFDSVGTPRADGRTEINPKIHKIIETFRAKETKVPGQPSGAMAVKSLVGVPFDVQPIPVEVPKASFSSKLARRPF